MDKMQEVKNNIANMAKQYGHTVMYIFGDEDSPSFHYTVGLWDTYGHPEIIVFGLPPETGKTILNIVAEKIKDKGTPNKLVFQTGVDQNDIANLPLQFIDAKPKYVNEHFMAAINYNKTDQFPIMQLVLCDRNGKFPWDKDCDKDFKLVQPLLNK